MQAWLDLVHTKAQSPISLKTAYEDIVFHQYNMHLIPKGVFAGDGNGNGGSGSGGSRSSAEGGVTISGGSADRSYWPSGGDGASKWTFYQGWEDFT